MDFYGVVWLLPPNKTEATAYLDGDGPKPARYARTIGQGDCFRREYMVGYVESIPSTRRRRLTSVRCQPSPYRKRDQGYPSQLRQRR